ncbi:MAG: hypothetical protein IKW05_05655 [Muribaculaceae bacterium]|nr:hypothetical protein [Muribaculaceae bacterium]
MNIEKVVRENKTRISKLNEEYMPHIGKGGYGERKIFHLPDSPIPLQYIPKEMEEVELVALLKQYGSIKNFASKYLKVKATNIVIDEVWKHYIKIRI